LPGTRFGRFQRNSFCFQRLPRGRGESTLHPAAYGFGGLQV
jgi:hypothetical protein